MQRGRKAARQRGREAEVETEAETEAKAGKESAKETETQSQAEELSQAQAKEQTNAEAQTCGRPRRQGCTCTHTHTHSASCTAHTASRQGTKQRTPSQELGIPYTQIKDALSKKAFGQGILASIKDKADEFLNRATALSTQYNECKVARPARLPGPSSAKRQLARECLKRPSCQVLFAASPGPRLLLPPLPASSPSRLAFLSLAHVARRLAAPRSPAAGLPNFPPARSPACPLSLSRQLEHSRARRSRPNPPSRPARSPAAPACARPWPPRTPTASSPRRGSWTPPRRPWTATGPSGTTTSSRTSAGVPAARAAGEAAGKREGGWANRCGDEL
jgi:hypothetical protein